MASSSSSTTPSSKATALEETKRLVKGMTSSFQDGGTDNLPGIQHLIIDPNDDSGSKEAVHLSCAGVLDKGGSQLHEVDAVDPSTLFMAYSCTKIITSVAILQLCQKQQLQLEDPLEKHFPSHPYDDKDNKLTIATLLNHTSGIPNPIPIDWFFVAGACSSDEERQERRTVAFEATLDQNSNLEFEPGSQKLYGNLSYWILEKVIEKVSGVSYKQYVQENIFDPLHIPAKEATFDLLATASTSTHNKLARGHIPKYSLTNALCYWWLGCPQQYWIQPSASNNKTKTWSRFATLQHNGLGYGGLYCTANALGKIVQDLLLPEDSVLLFEEMKLYMFEPLKKLSGSGTTPKSTMGGWVTGEIHGGIPYFGKQGGGFGFHANLRLYPTLNIATVYLANSTEISESPIDSRSNILDKPIVQYYNEEYRNKNQQNNNKGKVEEKKEG